MRGAPTGRDLDFWLLAEREWIEHRFVPSRPCDGTRPTTPAEAELRDEARAERSARKQRRRERATAD